MRDQSAEAMSAEEDRDVPLIYHFRGVMCPCQVASGRDDFCISCFLKWGYSANTEDCCVLTLVLYFFRKEGQRF